MCIYLAVCRAPVLHSSAGLLPRRPRLLLADSGGMNCFLQRQPGWPICLSPEASGHSRSGERPKPALVGQFLLDLAWSPWEGPVSGLGSFDQAGPWSHQAHLGRQGNIGPFQGLKSMVQARKDPESALAKVPPGGITTEQ